MSNSHNFFNFKITAPYLEQLIQVYTVYFNQINCAHLDVALGKILTETTLSISLK